MPTSNFHRVKHQIYTSWIKMINFIAKNIKFAHFWASNHRHRSASRMMNIERYGCVTPSITKGVSEKNVFKNQKINPKHLGSVNVSTALHRFYNRWFSVKKVAGRAGRPWAEPFRDGLLTDTQHLLKSAPINSAKFCHFLKVTFLLTAKTPYKHHIRQTVGVAA